MNKKIIAAAAISMLLPVAGLAAEKNLSYSFVEFGYSDYDDDELNVSFDGFTIQGSFEVTDMFFVFAGYSDFGTSGVDSTTLTLGGGLALGITDNADFFARLAYLDNEIDLGGFGSIDDTGFGIELGVRALFTPQFEGFGSVQYVDLYDDSETTLSVGGRYWITNAFGISLAYEHTSDVSGFTLAGRFNF